MSASKTYNGNDEWTFFTSTGKEIVLNEEEMQEMLDTLQEMGELENSTPDKIVELENKISDMKDKEERLQSALTEVESSDRELEELKDKIRAIEEEF